MTGPEESAKHAMKPITQATDTSDQVYDWSKRRPTPAIVTQAPIIKLPSSIKDLLPNLFNKMKTPMIVKNKFVPPIKNEIISGANDIEST